MSSGYQVVTTPQDYTQPGRAAVPSLNSPCPCPGRYKSSGQARGIRRNPSRPPPFVRSASCAHGEFLCLQLHGLMP